MLPPNSNTPLRPRQDTAPIKIKGKKVSFVARPRPQMAPRTISARNDSASFYRIRRKQRDNAAALNAISTSSESSQVALVNTV